MRYLVIALLLAVLVSCVSSQSCPGLIPCTTGSSANISQAGEDKERICSAHRDGIACLERLDCPGLDGALKTAREDLKKLNCIGLAGFVSFSLVSILAGLFIALFV